MPLQVLQNHYNSPYLENTLTLRIFGCTGYVHLHNTQKLDPRAVRCLFLGYSGTQKGYKCYDPLTKRLFVTYDVTFHEDVPFYPQSSIQGENWSEFQPENKQKPESNINHITYPELFIEFPYHHNKIEKHYFLSK